MASSHGEQLLKNATATGAVFDWPGGLSVFSVVCSNWNGATVTLEAMGPDGTTMIPCGTNTTLTANGMGAAYLPPCQVQAVISGAVPSAGVYAALSRVVG